MAALLTVERLTVSIGSLSICRDLDLTIESGQRWGILGQNGVGKTTLLHTLAGLRAPAAGRILLQGSDLRRLSRRCLARSIGVMFQDNAAPLPASVMDTALLGRYPHLGLWEWESERDRAQARTALDAVGLLGLAERPVATLSGGERQRLALATLLTQAPRLFLLDEPTSHLDLRHRTALLELISNEIRGCERGLIMTLHDVNLAARHCDHLLLLFGEGFTLSGTKETLLSEEHLYQLYGHPVHVVSTPTGPAYLPA